MVNGRFLIICGMTLLLAPRVDGIPSFIKGYKMIRHRNRTMFHSYRKLPLFPFPCADKKKGLLLTHVLSYIRPH